MPRNKAIIAIVALVLTGCAPKPTFVQINFDQIESDSASSISVVQESIKGLPPKQNSLPMLREGRLYGSLDESVKSSIIKSLQESREKAFQRALDSLRKQYTSGIDASVSDAKAAVREADKADWDDTTQRLRTIFDQYAPKEGSLRMAIYALANSLPKQKPATSIQDELQTQLQAVPEKTIKLKEADLKKLMDEFQSEISPILESYYVRQSERDLVPKTIAEELQAKFEAEAQRTAQQIVNTTFQSDEPFNIILKEKLEEISAISTQSAGTKTSNLRIQSDPQSPYNTLELEANVFAETRGYTLGKIGKDVTKEFIEWRKTHRP